MVLSGRASNAMRVGGAFKVHAHKKKGNKEQLHKSHISKSTSRSFPPSVFSNDPTSPKGGKLRATFHRRRGPVWNFLRWVRVNFFHPELFHCAHSGRSAGKLCSAKQDLTALSKVNPCTEPVSAVLLCHSSGNGAGSYWQQCICLTLAGYRNSPDRKQDRPSTSFSIQCSFMLGYPSKTSGSDMLITRQISYQFTTCHHRPQNMYHTN